MTCREKLKIEHPECTGDIYGANCKGCPHDYYYLPKDLKYCNAHSCVECWNRDIPEDNTIKESLEKAGVSAVEASKALHQLTNIILDSGDRTEFESGAVRDMHEGKGRCDLMPLDVVADVIHDEIIGYIYSFQKYGSVPALLEILRTQKMFPDIHTMFLEVAKHFEDGCKKYGENNWRKGIPCKVYIDSAVRHYLKYLRGDTDERHDRAFIWNIMCCIWTYEHKPELRGDIGGKSV